MSGLVATWLDSEQHVRTACFDWAIRVQQCLQNTPTAQGRQCSTEIHQVCYADLRGWLNKVVPFQWLAKSSCKQKGVFFITQCIFLHQCAMHLHLSCFQSKKEQISTRHTCTWCVHIDFRQLFMCIVLYLLWVCIWKETSSSYRRVKCTSVDLQSGGHQEASLCPC